MNHPTSANRLKKLFISKQEKVNGLKKALNKETKELLLVKKTMEVNKIKCDPIIPKVEIPRYYKVDFKWETKILFTLNKYGSASIARIVKAIVKREKGCNYTLTYRKIQQTILRMLNTKKLIKDGEYNSKYRINKRSIEASKVAKK